MWLVDRRADAVHTLKPLAVLTPDLVTFVAAVLLFPFLAPPSGMQCVHPFLAPPSGMQSVHPFLAPPSGMQCVRIAIRSNCVGCRCIAGHLIHMASHLDVHMGLFNRAVDARLLRDTVPCSVHDHAPFAALGLFWGVGVGLGASVGGLHACV